MTPNFLMTAAGGRRRRGAAPFTGTLIDSAWLSANGPAPYYLSTADEEYRLAADVTTDLDAFAVTGNNITLDLYGHTVTFNNADSQQIVNSNFTDNTTGWDLSGASGASRKTDATFLGGTCYNGTTSLEITVPDSTTYYIETSADVDLVTGEFYGLSFWHDETDVTLTYTIGTETGAITKREFIGTFAHAEFEAASTQSAPLRISIANSSGSSQTIYLDEIRFTKARNYGVVIPHGTSRTPNVTGTQASGFRLTSSVAGGKIVEGTGGHDCGCVFGRGVTGLTVDGFVELETHIDGLAFQNGSCINGQYAVGLTVSSGVKLNNKRRKVCRRQDYQGYSIFSQNAAGDVSITGVEAVDSPHGMVAISTNTGANGAITITDCFGALRAKYTNGFYIECRDIGGTANHVIANNSFDMTNDADAHGRFLHIDNKSGTGTLTISGNTTVLRDLEENQEYGGFTLKGTYGIQFENQTNNTTISNNTVTITGSGGGSAYRFGPVTGTALDISFSGSLTATVDADAFTERSFCANFHSNAGDDYGSITGAVFVTNDSLFSIDPSNTSEIVFEAPTIRYINDGSTHGPFYRAYEGAGTIAIRNSSIFDAGTRTWLQTGMDSTGGGTSTTATVYFEEDCIITIEDGGVPQSGVSVTVTDTDTNTVASGTTDANGQLAATIEWFRVSNTLNVETITDPNPFTIATNYGGGTSDSWTLTDATREITVDVTGA